MTDYIVNRWYRAPEIMLSKANYTISVDMWAVGCILGELLKGKPIFKGKDNADQLNQILHWLGKPSEDTLRRTCSVDVQGYIRSLAIPPRVQFTEIFQGANPLALDLLVKMLTFNPAERITCEQALEHPYLVTWHDPADEPVCPTKIDFSFDKEDSIEGLKKLIAEEVNLFRSEISAAAQSNQNQQLKNPSRDDIVASESPIFDDPPLDGVPSGHGSGQTYHQESGGVLSATPKEESEKMHRESDLRVTTMQSHVVSPQGKTEDDGAHAHHPVPFNQRIKELEDELDTFYRRAEEQSTTILALQKELEKLREEYQNSRDREARYSQQDEELQVLRERCERLEEELIEQLLSDTDGFISEVSDFSVER